MEILTARTLGRSWIPELSLIMPSVYWVIWDTYNHPYHRLHQKALFVTSIPPPALTHLRSKIHLNFISECPCKFSWLLSLTYLIYIHIHLLFSQSLYSIYFTKPKSLYSQFIFFHRLCRWESNLRLIPVMFSSFSTGILAVKTVIVASHYVLACSSLRVTPRQVHYTISPLKCIYTSTRHYHFRHDC